MDTGGPQPHYEAIECRARPARVAVLMDSSDVDWRHTAVRIIEVLNSIWGGKHSIIVPTDGLTIEPTFWAVLERFSPDFLYVYAKTGADIKISSPEKYAALLQQRIQQFGNEIIALEGEKERIDKELQSGWAGEGFDLSDDLRSQIVNRLVPFHFERNLERVTCQGVLPRLTKIVDVLPCIGHPRVFASFRVPTEVDSLWWIAQTGMYSAAVSDQLLEVGLTEHIFNVSTDQLQGFASWIAGGAVSVAGAEIERCGYPRRG